MSKFPQDIMAKAITLSDEISFGGYEVNALAIAAALMAERDRCALICYAEREWGGELIEATERIEKGMEPRRIPGWNCPSED